MVTLHVLPPTLPGQPRRSAPITSRAAGLSRPLPSRAPRSPGTIGPRGPELKPGGVGGRAQSGVPGHRVPLSLPQVHGPAGQPAVPEGPPCSRCVYGCCRHHTRSRETIGFSRAPLRQRAARTLRGREERRLVGDGVCGGERLGRESQGEPSASLCTALE